MTIELSNGSPISVLVEGSSSALYGLYVNETCPLIGDFIIIQPWDSTHPLAKIVACVQKLTIINLKFVKLVQELENSNVKTATPETERVTEAYPGQRFIIPNADARSLGLHYGSADEYNEYLTTGKRPTRGGQTPAGSD